MHRVFKCGVPFRLRVHALIITITTHKGGQTVQGILCIEISLPMKSTHCIK